MQVGRRISVYSECNTPPERGLIGPGACFAQIRYGPFPSGHLNNCNRKKETVKAHTAVILGCLTVLCSIALAVGGADDAKNADVVKHGHEVSGTARSCRPTDSETRGDRHL